MGDKSKQIEIDYVCWVQAENAVNILCHSAADMGTNVVPGDQRFMCMFVPMS